MTLRASHLVDDRLYGYYLAARQGEALDPPVAEHLADCRACAARYTDLVRTFDGLRREADAETLAVFTPERLLEQQQRIARRIEHIGHTARVITFPGQTVGRPIPGSPSHSAARWIATAAAAGLFIGVALGASYEWQLHSRGGLDVRRTRSLVAATREPSLTPRATDGTGAGPAIAADDAFLSDLERALDRPHTRELQPFDDFTPHVREVLDIR